MRGAVFEPCSEPYQVARADTVLGSANINRSVALKCATAGRGFGAFAPWTVQDTGGLVKLLVLRKRCCLAA